MKHVQVRLEDSDFEAVEQRQRKLGYPSLQKALEAVLVRWGNGDSVPEPSALMKPASEFEQVAPRTIREFVRDTMKRFIKVAEEERAEEEKPKRKRRKAV